ncbi:MULTISPECIES: hypothetical protein [unclassified Ensifer]|uniref:hypothetical protein n=1 Tax=unclassified Ensifer TaxID=2633371 RepID=UPI000B2865EC|nr:MULTISPECIES: hypothetical protein [unclassified Ensifer]
MVENEQAMPAMEYGWFHPDRGYWQTNTYPSENILNGYPVGTIATNAIKPSAEHEWESGAWVHHPPPEPTPEELRARMQGLTARQFRLGLLAAGIPPAQVSATIEAMAAGPEKEKAQIEWEYATTFNRMHPLIATVGAALNLTDMQIDAMWRAALQL